MGCERPSDVIPTVLEIAHVFDCMGGSRDEIAYEIGELMSYPAYREEWVPNAAWMGDYVCWNGLQVKVSISKHANCSGL